MASIVATSYYLPEHSLSNVELNELFPEWSVDKISAKTGIRNRHIAAPDEFVSDMAICAARKLFDEYQVDPGTIDFVMLCTQSPDYFLPTTACLVQNALGLPTSCGALDFNLGCSGYIYGLSLAKGLVESGEARRVLFLTSEAYSKFLDAADKSVRTIFGDAASASLITLDEKMSDEGQAGKLAGKIGRFSFGTDGSGYENLIVRSGGMREPGVQGRLYMNGPDIFSFTLRRVPEVVADTLQKNNLSAEEIDLFVFHQANQYMLEHLQGKMGLPAEKCFLHLADCGNTVSATIPIALKATFDEGRLQPGMTVLLAGFGVGYSWGATVCRF